MSETHVSTEYYYEIRLKGHLDDQWANWFEGMTITLEENGDTLLVGPVVDQAALHGLLKKVRDLGIPLLSLNPKKTDALGNLFAAEWLIPAGLILLSAIPVLGGAVRMAELTGGAEITPDNARFFASPLPVVLHIISVTLYCVLGAFQFAPGFRRRRRGWHRIAGRILVPCGLIAALSGLWMRHFYPLPESDGEPLYGLRLFFGLAIKLRWQEMVTQIYMIFMIYLIKKLIM